MNEIKQLPVLTAGAMRCRDCTQPIRLGFPSTLTEYENEGSIYYAISHLPGDCDVQAEELSA